jgi:4-alpha-glucanotransferase
MAPQRPDPSETWATCAMLTQALGHVLQTHFYYQPGSFMLLPRASGILLHPTSLPSYFGIGELGSNALGFIDFLAATGQQFWQVLPLGPTGYGNSPYMCYSAIAGNPLLISLEVLRADGLLNDQDLAHYPHWGADRVNFDGVLAAKMPLLRRAFERFKELEPPPPEPVPAPPPAQDSLDISLPTELDVEELVTEPTIHLKDLHAEFVQAKAHWLADYALFMALKTAHNNQSWYEWEPAIAHREAAALAEWRTRLADEVAFHEYLQFEFFRQWGRIKAYANRNHVQIIGDIPIYVAHDSVDVWADPKNFQLDPQTGAVAHMAGVPPDYFSETGQLWGNPVYDWDHLQKTGFAWWINRFEAMLDTVDWIRVDHFRGFEAYWSVPKGEKTAINGTWVEAPGQAFFAALQAKLGKLPILAEDLGVITPAVEALRDGFELPGMKVLQFAFGSDPANVFLPFNYPRNCLVYTGTHDNNTTVGWFDGLEDWERRNLMAHIGTVTSDGIHWDLIRVAMGSVAQLAIVPFQDVLGHGEPSRMNFPGKAEGNWEWRYQEEMVNQGVRDRLRWLTERSGRWRH